MTWEATVRIVFTSSNSSVNPNYSFIVHSCGLFLINIECPSVVEYLYDELDGVSDLMSPVQPLDTS